MVVIGIVVDGWDWYRRWSRMVLSMVVSPLIRRCLIDDGCWLYRRLLILIIADGWDCGYQYCRLLILVLSMVSSILWMVEIIDIGFVDGWDWYRQYGGWSRLLILVSLMVEIDIVDGQDYWYWYRQWLRLISLMVANDIFDGGMIFSMVVSISSIVYIDNRWWLRLWLLILSIVDIGIDIVDCWYW